MKFLIVFFIVIIVLAIFLAIKRFGNSKKPLANIIRSVDDQIKEKRETKILNKLYLKDGPLGLSQGKNVTLDTALLMKAEQSGSMVPSFDKNYRVGAVGSFTLMGMSFYRFYLGEGDETFLQFIMDSSNNVKECMLFTKVVSATPDEDGWDYLCGDQGMLGLYELSLKTKTDEDIVYKRVFEPYNGKNTRIEPKEFYETILAEDGSEFKTKCGGVLYSRDLGDDEEYAWVQVMTILQDDTTSCDAYIGFIVPDETWISVS